jgi:hypothetical protein
MDATYSSASSTATSAVSVDDFDENAHSLALTPRSRRACLHFTAVKLQIAHFSYYATSVLLGLSVVDGKANAKVLSRRAC